MLLTLAAGFLFVAFNELGKTIFPWAQTEFSYDMEPVTFDRSNIRYSVPKAYLHHKIDMGGGKRSPNLWVSWKDDMKPWTLSESFTRKDKDAAMYVLPSWRLKENFDNEYFDKARKDMIERMKRNFASRIDEVDKGSLMGIFHQYDSLSKISNTNPSGKGTKSFLVPLTKEKPYKIWCYSNLSPDDFCTIETYTENRILYTYKMKFKYIKDYIERGKQVDKLIQKLIIKEKK